MLTNNFKAKCQRNALPATVVLLGRKAFFRDDERVSRQFNISGIQNGRALSVLNEKNNAKSNVKEGTLTDSFIYNLQLLSGGQITLMPRFAYTHQKLTLKLCTS